MRFLFLLLILVSLPGLAANEVSLRNDREGESFYNNRSNDKAMKKALRQIDGYRITDAFKSVLGGVEENKLCSYDINETLSNYLKDFAPGFNQLEGAIYHLRAANEIDDSVAKILLNAHQTLETNLHLPKDSNDLFLPAESKVQEILPIVESFKSKYQDTSCLDDAYKNMYYDIAKIDKGIKSHQLEAIYVEAHTRKLIDTRTYMILEKARVSDLQNSGLTLKNYYQKIKSLRNQYPLRDSTEQSDFVTAKVEKMKVSRRQRLLENYTDLQIIMMGNVIKKLRTRLESPKVEILIYDRSQGVETITLEPMERFRLAIKLLRKEMAYLALNTYFAGRSPDYMDLMTAAYETGIIPASELDELGGLKEIWNPKKTFWEKARVWVQTLSSVATIVIPPPYGFIPALAVVVIEATAGKKQEANGEDPTSLF